MHRLLNLIACIGLLCFYSCNDECWLMNSTKVFPEPSKQRQDTILKEATTNVYYSQLYRPASNGIIANYVIPEEIKEHEIKIVFNGKARSNFVHSAASIVVAILSEDKSAVIWTPVNLQYYFTELNQWCSFKDSVIVRHEAWQKPFYYINTFAFLGNANGEKFDIQNLEVQVSACKK